MSALPKPRLTPAEYLVIEREAATKSEYLDGEVFAMAGGSSQRSIIALNVASEIRNALKGRPCVTHGPDMKVWIENSQSYVYPDVSGLCGPLETADGVADAYSNPSYVIEVLSASTETYDRSGKFHRYQTLPSLQDYVLIAQDKVAVEIFQRHEAGWFYRSLLNLEDHLRLESVGCEVPLTEIYRNVAFTEGADSAPS